MAPDVSLYFTKLRHSTSFETAATFVDLNQVMQEPMMEQGQKLISL